MLALGPYPRFAGSTVRNIETSWKKIVEGFGVEDAGGMLRDRMGRVRYCRGMVLNGYEAL